jgi:hypothetical protein
MQGQGRIAAKDDLGRYDCREVFENMEFRASDGDTAPYRCGSWECYCCGYRMRQNLVEEISRVCEERPEMRRMMTLTLDPAKVPSDPEEQHQYLTEVWNGLRTEINDEYGSLSYIWVREDGEKSDSPHPHLHIIVDRYIPQAWISDVWSRLGGGEVVDIRYLDRVEKAAHYVGKYLTKEALSGLPDGIRRYGSSQDIDLAVRGSDDDGDDDREWQLLIEDRRMTAVGTDEYLVRGVAPSDFVLQRRWGGPEPPPG